jgi:hypothetical protein
MQHSSETSLKIETKTHKGNYQCAEKDLKNNHGWIRVSFQHLRKAEELFPEPGLP